jgi:molecular chaperone DnaK
MAEDNKTLARFELVGIPPAPRGVPQIEVSFDIDANGIVGVSAKDLGTGKQQSVRITSSSGLTEDEIQRMIAEAESSRDDDVKKRELADVRGNAEGLIYTSEKSLEEYGHVLDEDDASDIAQYLSELKAVAETDDVVAIRNAIQQLEAVSHKMAEVMYQEVYESMDGEDDFDLGDDD